MAVLLAACGAMPVSNSAVPAQIVAKTRVFDTGCQWTYPLTANVLDTADTKAEILAWYKAWAINCPAQAVTFRASHGAAAAPAKQ
jgi:hypothetical protein